MWDTSIRTSRKGLFAGLVLVVGSGCSTIHTQTGDPDCDQSCWRVSQVYSGTAQNICCISRCGSVGSSFAVVDLPFSLIADTLMVPVTIYKQFSRGSICESEGAEEDKNQSQ